MCKDQPFSSHWIIHKIVFPSCSVVPKLIRYTLILFLALGKAVGVLSSVRYKFMKTRKNQAIRKLREILKITQSQMAEMIGASKSAVVSWENGRKKLSARMAQRLLFATGAHPGYLLRGRLRSFFFGEAPYTRASYEKNLGIKQASSVEEYLEVGTDSLFLIYKAASMPKNKDQTRLFPVAESFEQWLEDTANEFGLKPAIQSILKKRTFTDSLTLTYDEWRTGTTKAIKEQFGFKDDKTKRGTEKLHLEVTVHPVWAPGADMRQNSADCVRAVS